MSEMLDVFNSYPGNLPENISKLREAILQKNLPGIREALGLCGQTFSLEAEAAFNLLREALDSGMPPDVFAAILDRCPPVPEVLSSGYLYILDNADMETLPTVEMPLLSRLLYNPCGLLEKAAFLDRADVMSLLLERGAGPNQGAHFDYSPLETALIGLSLNSVELLMRQPELDTAWTDTLLRIWALPRAPRPRLELCLRAMAPRFTGWNPDSGQSLPVPGAMQPDHIADSENWPLLERFCRERSHIPQEQGERSISLLSHFIERQASETEERESACIPALTALLDSCPNLLEGERGCRALLRCFLYFGESARERIRPWVESLGRRRIEMLKPDWAAWGWEKFPDYWQSLLPDGPILTVDRWSGIWNINDWVRLPRNAEALSHILDMCPICGEGRKGRLSPLAIAVLHFGGLSLILPLLRQSGGLLATEDPDALLKQVLYRTAGKGGDLVAERIMKIISAPSERTPEQTRRLVEKLLILQSLCS